MLKRNATDIGIKPFGLPAKGETNGALTRRRIQVQIVGLVLEDRLRQIALDEKTNIADRLTGHA